MAVKILTIHDIGPEKWDVVRALSHPQGSLYHTSAWHRAIEESYGYKTRYLVLPRLQMAAIRSGHAGCKPAEPVSRAAERLLSIFRLL